MKKLPSKAVILAFDHGLEHGPQEYHGIDMSPQRIVDIARKGGADALMMNTGAWSIVKNPGKVLRIIKLTGRTSMSQEMVQEPHTTVKDAMRLKPDVVACSVYPGSPEEDHMIYNSSIIKEEAHKNKVGVLGIIYPRTPTRYTERDLIYAARIGSEMDFDYIKTYHPNNATFERVAKAAFKPIFASGGKIDHGPSYLNTVKEVMKSGGAGVAVGRDVWMRDDAADYLKKIVKIVKKK